MSALSSVSAPTGQWIRRAWDRLRHWDHRWTVLIVIFGLLAILPIVFPSPYTISVFLFYIPWYVAMAQSWNISGGYSGQLSFGHWGLLGVGAYTTAILAVTDHWSVVTAMLMAAVVTFLLGLLIGYIGSGLRGVYFAIATLAAASLMQLIILNWQSVTLGSLGFPIFFILISPSDLYYAALTLAVIATLMVYGISRSRLGLAFEAVRENEDVAIATGVYARGYKALAFGLSASIMGPVGGLYALASHYIDPTSAFNLLYNLQIILMVIVGGRAKVFGPVVAAVIFAWVFEVALTSFNVYNYLITGVVIFVAVLFLSRGIFGFRGTPKVLQF
ncbi:MAG: branched-chain amino acid ABC transporter permease [Thermoplasmata archaeon]